MTLTDRAGRTAAEVFLLVAAKADGVTQMQASEVIRESMSRHRAKEFLRFLKKIDAAIAIHLDVHVLCDNYMTHKTKEVQAWLAKHSVPAPLAGDGRGQGQSRSRA